MQDLLCEQPNWQHGFQQEIMWKQVYPAALVGKQDIHVVGLLLVVPFLP